MRRFVLATAVVLASLVMLAGCGLPSDGSPRALAEDDVPFDILSPTTTPPEAAGRRSAELYFVEEGHLTAVIFNVTELTPRGLLEALVAATPPRSLTSPVKETTAIKATAAEGTTLNVTLSNDINLGNPDQKLAFAQLVFTATSLDETVKSVRFYLEDSSGQPVPLNPPTDSGNVTDRPLSRNDYQQVAPTTTTTSTTSTTRPGQTTTTRPRSGG